MDENQVDPRPNEAVLDERREFEAVEMIDTRSVHSSAQLYPDLLKNQKTQACKRNNV